MDAASCAVGDTWTFNGSTWAEQFPSVSPSPRYGAQMAFDAALGYVVLFGGDNANGVALADTWVWTGSNWSKLAPPVSPPGRAAGAFTYDAARSELVLFGGNNGTADTWVFSASGWSHLSPAASPPDVAGTAMAFDAATGTDVLFDESSTWLFNGSAWTEVFPVDSPPLRNLFGLAYDPDLGAVVLFGGFTAAGFVNDTWAWNGSNWLSAGSIAAPAGRAEMAMDYDSTRHEIVLFGGFTIVAGTFEFGDTWTYNPAVPAVTVVADQSPTSPYQRGAVVTYTATVVNPDVTTMTGASLTDTFPAGLSPMGSTVTITDLGYPKPNPMPVGCSAPVSCTASANQIVVSGLTIGQGDSFRVVYRAVAVGADGGCDQFMDSAVAADSFGSSPRASATVAICGTGLGMQPWQSFVSRSLGPQSTANVNVATGNLVVEATDATVVQTHGHLALALQRTYNSADPSVGLLGVGWTVGLSGVGQVGGAGGLGVGTVALAAPSNTASQPVSVTLTDGDGARDVFTSKGPVAVDVGASGGSSALAGTTLANLIPRVLGFVSGFSICVDQSFRSPPGVHMTLYRYLQVSGTGSGVCAQGQGLANAVELGFVAESTDGLRYEFAATGQLLDVLDRNGAELTYVYNGESGGIVPPQQGMQGLLQAVYQPTAACSVSGSASPGAGCRDMTFAYTVTGGQVTDVQVTDPSGRVTGYRLDTDSPQHLTEVDNPDGSTVKYSYGGCGGSVNELCSAGDPRGSSTNFTYQTPGAAGFATYAAAPIATISDRRGNPTTFSYAATTGMLGYTTVVEGAHQSLYDLIDSSGPRRRGG